MKKVSSSFSLRSLLLFGLVGASGALINTLFLYLLTTFLGLYYLLSSIIATEIAIIFNFFGNNTVTFRSHKGKKAHVKFFQFQLISMSTIIGTVVILFLLTSFFGKASLLIWNFIAIGIMSVANYFLNIRFTWKKVAVSEKIVLTQSIKDSRPVQYVVQPLTPHKFGVNPQVRLVLLTLLTFLFLTSSTVVALYINGSYLNDSSGNISITQSNYSNDSLVNYTEFNSTNISVPLISYLNDSFVNYTNDTLIVQPNISDSISINSNLSSNSSFISLLVPSTSLVAVSQLGYHPNSTKQVVVYTNQTQGTFNILNSGVSVFNGQLLIPKDAFGANVSCQGNQSCLVGDFSGFTTPGSYTINVSGGANSPPFIISKDIYKNNIPVFFEFFNAEQQQNSSYHADFHSGYNPLFVAIADGSPIMQSDQASVSLIRLGSAYNRDPSLFLGTQDQAVIKSYVSYLASLQGLTIQNMSPSDPGYQSGFRLNALVKINNIFYPGPVPGNISSMNVYSSPGAVSDPNLPVTSLCGAGVASNKTWKACIDYAANYFKCQIDEPCVNATYDEQTGKVTANYATTGNYGVAVGWSVAQEFGCFDDSNLQTGNWNNKTDPCFMFLANEDPKNTASTLLGFLEALPALNDADPVYAQQIFSQSVATYQYIQRHDSTYWQNATSDSQGTGYLGASEFLLYDYTGNVSYLQAAYAMRTKVDTALVSDATHGNEFYWQEYILNKNAINQAGLQYNYLNNSPEELVYQGALWQAWKDRLPNSISQSGERVFQFDNQYSKDPNQRIQFQSSRYILTMGLIATKTEGLDPVAQSFDKIISDDQLAWITGMNSVLNGVALNSSTRSYSFIFGIGQSINPLEFHSRYLINTGFTAATASNPLGQVVGVRGSGKEFFNGTNYVYLDGTFNILGSVYGAPGNSYHNEKPVTLWSNQTFSNGKTNIPGWINGAFANPANLNDTIWVYNDDRNAYEYTESTNEIVSTAIEYFAYADAQYNNQPSHIPITFSTGPINNTNTTTIVNSTLSITSYPVSASLYINGNYKGITPYNSAITPGIYNLVISKSGYLNLSDSITVITNQTLNITYNLTVINNTDITNTNGTLFVDSLPQGASIFINGSSFVTPSSISLVQGNYNIILTKNGYSNISDIVNIISNQTLSKTYSLNAVTSNVTNITIVSSTTSLPFALNSSTGALYEMFEADTAYFNVTLSGNASVNWSIGGIAYNTTQTGTEHSISWRPNILTTSNVQEFLITATTGSASTSWTVDVYNTLNPFFSPVESSSGTIIFVFTNDKKSIFRSVSVQINNKQYNLQNMSVPNNETQWSLFLADSEFACGNNDLQVVSAISLDNLHNYNETLPSDSRGFVKDCPSPANSGGSNSGGNGGGGGSSSSSTGNSLSLIYVLLGKDFINQNETEGITMDLRSDQGISSAEALFSAPDGTTFTATLKKISGTNYYGTWQANITGNSLSLGLYTLKTISAHSLGNSQDFPITDRSFYVVGDSVDSSEHLQVVYTLLDKSSVDQISNVTLKLDARDIDGVQSINATIDKIHGSKTTSFTIPLKLISGKRTYGTWQGLFEVTDGDTTYKITEVTLSNFNSTRVQTINDRTVYATSALPFPVENNAGITGSVIGENFSNLSKSPFILTIVAILITALISGSFLLERYISNNRKVRGG